jgi:hypothetical protein
MEGRTTMKRMITISLLLSTAALAAPDPKAGAPAVPPKAAEPAGPPKPAQELTDMAKGMAGTWKCTGKAEMGGVTGDIKGTITHKTDLDGFWIQSSLTATAAKGTFHATFMTTYDPGSKRFFRQTATGHGGHGAAWGTTEGTKTSWEGDDFFGGNSHKIRGTEEMVSPKEVHIVGEYSDDGGKTWKLDHDVTCKK